MNLIQQLGVALADVTAQTKAIFNLIFGVAGGIIGLLAMYLAYKFFTADDDSKRKNAKGQMIYAIIGVMVIIIVIVLWNTVLAGAVTGASNGSYS